MRFFGLTDTDCLSASSTADSSVIGMPCTAVQGAMVCSLSQQRLAAHSSHGHPCIITHGHVHARTHLHTYTYIHIYIRTRVMSTTPDVHEQTHAVW